MRLPTSRRQSWSNLKTLKRNAKIEERANKIMDAAKAEILAKGNAIIAELAELGLDYRFVEGKAVRTPNPEQVCPICLFRTNPPHDRRKHRNQPLPEGFVENDEKGARQYVADLVLGTKNQGGGPSVFQQFPQILEERKLLELIRSRMTTVTDTVPWPARTLARIYESVADETGRHVEYIRKLFERHDRNAGSFSIRAVRAANKRGASLISSRQTIDRALVKVTVEKFILKEMYFEGATSSF
jgi:hypothetical protein